MASYPENTGGIIAAINACILAAGGTVTSYNNNTGGIIQALLALQTAIAGMGGGSAVEIELTAGEVLNKGDVVYIDSNGKLMKAIQDSTRDIATVAGLIKANVAMDSLAKLVFSGKIDLTGWGGAAFTPGDRYFLSGSGGLSQTPTSTAGEYVVLVGEALDANTLALNIDTPVLLS
tara:strand:- start:2216 stop:2743 length:528 start_codon:yes stop_codon:yes gene_type:complete